MISSRSRPRCDAVLHQLLTALGDQLGPELQGRQVGRDLDPLGPAGELLADALQHPATDRHDQAGLLGHLDELAGRHQPALGMTPAQERLEPDHSFVGQVDQRLVVKLELVALERVAQVPLDRHPLHKPVAQRDVEHLRAPAAELLSAVHGRVGVAEQLLGGLASALTDGDAEAGGDEHLVAINLERFEESPEVALSNLADRVIGDRSGADRGELVPARACDEVLLTHGRGQSSGHLAQERVTDRVSERVVDDLEAVEVEHQNADAVAQAPSVAKLGLKLGSEQRPIRQARWPTSSPAPWTVRPPSTSCAGAGWRTRSRGTGS